MSYDSLLINTCSIKHRQFDKWGTATSTVVSNIPCRFMNIIQKIIDLTGQEKQSAGKFFFKSSTTIEHQDLITYDGVDYAVIKINRTQNSIKHHHTEVWVDKARR